jgi:hypothetical protein
LAIFARLFPEKLADVAMAEVERILFGLISFVYRAPPQTFE